MENNNLPLAEKAHSVLIVDDNPQNLQVLGRLLKENNYNVEFAINGIAGLEWLESKQFDIILLDINMPEMDGFEMCTRIRSDSRFNNMPIIFLTADNDRESILKGFDLGAQDYVTKPFDSRELVVRVRTHLSLKDTRENLEILNKSLEEKVKERTLELSIANEKLEALNTKLLELDKAKTEFLNLISHEIRTPLNGILVPMEILKESLSTEETRELIDILDASVRRLEKFATNALLITRLRTYPNEIYKHDIDPRLMLSLLKEDFVSALELKKIKLNLTFEKFKGRLVAEPELVKKSLANVIDNAITYSPSGSNVEVNVSESEGYLLFDVHDQGGGFPRSLLGNDFEIFPSGRGYQDSSVGIGLPLVKMILEAHNGSITIKNNPDRGAVVRLAFPLES
ncbi:MAG: response regulator [Bacteroidales bacterium]